ncbi:MAG: metallophosphoesterase family protein [Actinobacteria bacterium]|nr:MAG: metallophosphoesterase family protein [Actinomycetota bacterium]
MRLALIADIHGNVPALENVLADLDRERVDRIICLGDVAVGPQPVETLERLQQLGCPMIMGNWDACMLGDEPKVDGELLRLDDDTTLLAFHGSPRSFDDEILATTPDEKLEAMLAGHDASVFAGGHTHFQMFRRHGESIVLNVGSIGQPFRRRRRGVMRVSPWAEYCVVGREDGRLTVELRRTPIDVDLFVRTMLASGMPHADQWADHWSPEVPA